VHPFFDRNYTAREGARLQSFPDWYVFCGRRTTMSWEKNLSQYQQIGNAVPPLLAKSIGEMIKVYFSNIENIKNKS
jgi:DNA (cytosine-5)-methyltransferase 1